MREKESTHRRTEQLNKNMIPSLFGTNKRARVDESSVRIPTEEERGPQVGGLRRNLPWASITTASSFHQVYHARRHHLGMLNLGAEPMRFWKERVDLLFRVGQVLFLLYHLLYRAVRISKVQVSGQLLFQSEVLVSVNLVLILHFALMLVPVQALKVPV